MADNYLENKMEEHRRSPSGVMPRRYSPIGRKRGIAAFNFGERNIIVSGCAAAPEVASAVIKALGETGSHVAFLWDDLSRGSRLAQATSTRHFPWADDRMEDVRVQVGRVDFEVTVSCHGVCVRYDGKRTDITGTDPEQLASAAVYALLPLSRLIAFREIHVGEGDVWVKTND